MRYDFFMNRMLRQRIKNSALMVSAIVLFISPLSAQIHGVPASATSLGPNGFTGGNSFAGIPAGATSLGPAGFADNRAFFNNSNALFNAVDVRLIRSDRLGRHAQPFFVPLMYSPFYYGMSDFTEITSTGTNSPGAQSQPAPQVPQKLEITIVDKRDDKRSDAKPGDSARASIADTDSLEPKRDSSVKQPMVQELTAKTLVMRDGSKKEIRNYAILGKDLFDLSDGRSRRIPLTAIDAAATAKLNEENGVDFRLP